MEGNSSCIVFYGIRNGRIGLRIYYACVYFPRSSEWGHERLRMRGQEAAFGRVKSSGRQNECEKCKVKAESL